MQRRMCLPSPTTRLRPAPLCSRGNHRRRGVRCSRLTRCLRGSTRLRSPRDSSSWDWVEQVNSAAVPIEFPCPRMTCNKSTMGVRSMHDTDLPTLLTDVTGPGAAGDMTDTQNEGHSAIRLRSGFPLLGSRGARLPDGNLRPSRMTPLQRRRILPRSLPSALSHGIRCCASIHRLSPESGSVMMR